MSVIKNVLVVCITEDQASASKVKEILPENECLMEQYVFDIDVCNTLIKTNPKDAIPSQVIDKNDILVVLISKKTKQSTCIRESIKYARKKGKKVIGVWLENSSDTDLLEEIDDYADSIITCDSGVMIDTILNNINIITCSDGKNRTVTQNITHQGC